MCHFSFAESAALTSPKTLFVGLAFFIATGTCQGQATGRLNDSGVTLCGNATSNSVGCAYGDLDLNGFPRQDGQYGRSAKELVSGAASLSKVGASTGTTSGVGFDFSKVLMNGTVQNGLLSAQTAALGTGATNWVCTKDNVTGLVWQVKQSASGNFRSADNTYSWYNTNTSTNGGNSGTAGGGTCSGTTCDTAALVTYLNGLLTTARVCAFTDWRIPTRSELMSIVDASLSENGTDTADQTFFPNMQLGPYWSADTYPDNNAEARFVNFGMGTDGVGPKGDKNYVILVRP